MTQTGNDHAPEEDHHSKPHSLTKNDLVGSHNLPDSLKALPGGKVFASTGPRIMLEIITARTAAVIIALTWTVFIICFSIDFYLTYKSFHSSNYVLTAFDCANYNLTTTEYLPEFSCGNGAEASWNATVTELSNVISFSMDVQQVNMSSLVANRTSNDFTFSYNLQVWTCYNENGCGESFDNSGTYTQDGNVWQKVLDLQGETIQVDLATAMVSDGAGDKKISLQLITNTFQNQESIPTNGLVKSYLVSVQYQSNPFNLFSSENPTTQEDTTYNFHVVRYPGNRVMAAINVILLVITVAVLGVYCYILYRNIGSLSNWKHSLSEQKWVVMYFFLVILFQNPVYCVIVWYTRQPPVTAAYATYLMNYIAQSGLFTLWLLFAHSYQRKVQRKTFFYGPKVFIGVVIFVFGVFILTYQFPSLALPRTDRSAVQAVENWTHRLKISFVICTIIYLICIMCWTVAWFVRLFLSGRMMNRLPYMSTRYMQLSFRFFSLQATLVTFYYIAQYCLVAYFISRDTTTGYATSLTVLADNINVLFRQQFQLFGKTFFLTTYAMILAFMFLPPDLLDSSGFYTTIAATYAISEDEHKEVVKGRRQALKNVKRNLINQMTRYDQLIRAKEDVFCVDLALKLRNVAFQSYYDRVDGAQTASSFGKTQDIGSFGFELIEEFYDSTHEVYCIIAREKVGPDAPSGTKDTPAETTATPINANKTGRIVVSFRGTASKRQMEDNMNYAQRPVDFQNLDIPSLDHLDRLTVPQNDPADEIDLETIEDEEDATILASTNAQTLQQRFLRSGTVTSTMSNPTAGGMNRPYAATSDASLPPASRPSFFRGPSLSLFGRPPTTAASVASTNASVNSVASQMTQDQERVAMQVLGIRVRKQPHGHAVPRSISSASDDYYDLESVQPPGDNGGPRFPAPLSPQSSSASYRFDGHGTNNSAKMTMSAGGAATGGEEAGRETIIERAGHMGGNFTNFLSDAVGATNQGIDMVVGATTGVVTTAARNTPGLKKFVTPNVHAGFWEAYTVVRGFLHGVLRAELMRRPTTVIFTGHSLGGALATFAALDFKITSLPRINAYLRHQAKKQLWRLQTMDLEQGSGGIGPGAYANPATANGAPSLYASLRQVLFPQLDTNGLDGDGGDLDDDEDEHHGGAAAATIKATKQQSFLKRFNPTKLFTAGGGGGAGGGGTANASAAGAADSMIGSNVGIYRPPSVDSASGNPTSPKHSLIPASSPPNSPPTANGGTTNSGGWGPFLSTQNSQTLRSAQTADIAAAAGGVGSGAGTGSTQFQAVFVNKIDVVMYNFGSPRVGNFAFKQLFDKEIPRAYRVVVDGDVVPGLPPSGYGYVHIGTEILIDSLGVGTIIIDPSFVERWLRTHLKSSISVHSLLVYRKGLLGVKLSAEALRDYATSEKKEHIDPTRLALTWRNRVQIEKLVESETAEDHPKTPTPSGGTTGGDTSPTVAAEDGAMGTMRRSSASAAALLASVGTMVQQTMRRGSHTPTTAATAATTATSSATTPATATDTTDATATATTATKADTAAVGGIRPFPLSLQSVTVQSMTGSSPRPGSGEKKIAAREDDETHSPLLAHHEQQLQQQQADDHYDHDDHDDHDHAGVPTNGESIVLASGGTEAKRKDSEQSFTSDDGISLRPVVPAAPAATTTTEAAPEAAIAMDLHARVSESGAVGVPADDEQAKKDTLRRMRMMEGSQEEDYYDHTERDYTDLMHQIRAARAANNPLNHIKRVNKLLPKFLKRQAHHHHQQPPPSTATSATTTATASTAAHDGEVDYVPPPLTNAALAASSNPTHTAK